VCNAECDCKTLDDIIPRVIHKDRAILSDSFQRHFHKLSHHVSEAKCPPRPTHFAAATWGRQHRSSSIPGVTGGILFVFWLPMRHGPQEYWHLHRSDCNSTLIDAHTTSRTLPLVTLSLGSLTVGMPEAGDFVESFEPYTSTSSRFTPKGKIPVPTG